MYHLLPCKVSDKCTGKCSKVVDATFYMRSPFFKDIQIWCTHSMFQTKQIFEVVNIQVEQENEKN